MCRALREMESFQFVSSMRSYVTSAGTKAPFKQSATQQAVRGKCREGRSVGSYTCCCCWDTLGSEPYFTSPTTTLSRVVFVWNFLGMFFVEEGREVTINLRYWSRPTMFLTCGQWLVGGAPFYERYGGDICDQYGMVGPLFSKDRYGMVGHYSLKTGMVWWVHYSLSLAQYRMATILWLIFLLSCFPCIPTIETKNVPNCIPTIVESVSPENRFTDFPHKSFASFTDTLR